MNVTCFTHFRCDDGDKWPEKVIQEKKNIDVVNYGKAVATHFQNAIH